MNANIKSLILLAVTLVAGFALGVFADASLARARREGLRQLQRPPGFVARLEHVIQPHSDAQRDSIRPVLEKQAARNAEIVRGSRDRLRAELDSMRVTLAPMLDASQRDRLAQELVRMPDPFGRGGPGRGARGRAGEPPRGRVGGPPGGAPPD